MIIAIMIEEQVAKGTQTKYKAFNKKKIVNTQL